MNNIKKVTKIKQRSYSSSRFIYSFLLALVLSSCSTAYLTLKSNPEGAVVYIVPKNIWDMDTVKYSIPANINDYVIKDGTTPLYTLQIRQDHYVVVFVTKTSKKYVKIDLNKAYRKKRSKIVEVSL